MGATICAVMGALGGLIIGLITEYFTSHTFVPTRELAAACKRGTAVNIIYGMALGYKSCIVPVLVLASAIFVSFNLCDLYGIALAALGMLSTLACGLTILTGSKEIKPDYDRCVTISTKSSLVEM